MKVLKKQAENIIGHLHESQAFIKKLQTDDAGFLELANLLRDYAGINMTLNDKNHSLMASRLVSILSHFKVKNYRGLSKLLQSGDLKVQDAFITALTTNTTHFFREKAHFDYLGKALSAILERKRKLRDRKLRVWCAAASTGQEPYTILMALLESSYLSLDEFDIKFLATDIDINCLNKAVAGIYSEKEVEDLSDFYRLKYFRKVDKDGQLMYQFLPNLAGMIKFATLNLVNEYPFQFGFDIIFCRNVLIYFDRETSIKVVGKLAKSLNPEGLLFLGHAESGVVRMEGLKSLAHSIYVRR